MAIRGARAHSTGNETQQQQKDLQIYWHTVFQDAAKGMAANCALACFTERSIGQRQGRPHEVGAQPGSEDSVPEDLIRLIWYGPGRCGGDKEEKRSGEETNFKITEGTKRTRTHEGLVEASGKVPRGKIKET